MAHIPDTTLLTDDNDMRKGAESSKGHIGPVEGVEIDTVDVVITYRVEPKREKTRRDLHIPDLSTLQQFSAAFLTQMMARDLIA